MRSIVKLSFAVSLIILGILFLLQNFGYLREDVVKFWPLILIVIGSVMMFEYYYARQPKSGDWL
jgi:hypothetical protein